MKRPILLLALFLICIEAFATNVTIIESESINSGHVMDMNWQTVATGMGYTAAIYPQSTLLTNTWFSTTDILIVSSGVITLPQQAVDTIQSFVKQGGHVYLQGEYLTTYTTDIAFQTIVDALGGSFTWNGESSGDLEPMAVSGSLSTTPNAVTSLSYFWYGVYGAGSGCNSDVQPFLQYTGLYYGFIYQVPSARGRMITTTDQDWINQYTSTTGALQLMQNILSNLDSSSVYVIVGGTNTVSVNDTSICGGSPVTLTATPSQPGGTYLWSPGGQTTQSITVNPATTTRYVVSYTTAACGTITDTATVTVGAVSRTSVAHTICQGASYTFGGHILTTAGTYHDTLTAATGCDSIVTLTLSVTSGFTTPVSKSICSGSSYTFGGHTLTTGGTYRDTLTSVAGCDSIIVLTLTVLPVVTTPVAKSICTGSSYTFGGHTLTTGGTYRDTVTAVAGCDSIIVLTLTVVPVVTTPVSKSICAGSSYTFGGHTLTTGGTYRDTLTSVAGCDSIIVLTLTTISPVTTPVSRSICAGSSYSFGGHTLTTGGTYRDTVTSVAGCDSIIVLTLTTIAPVTTPVSRSICAGSSYTFGGRTLTTAGTYSDTLTAVSGCDSIIILTLTIIPTVTTPVSHSICTGGSYTFGGRTLTTGGTYRDTLTAVSGCDSFIVLTLTVIPNVTTPVSHSICTGGSYTFGGHVLTTAGTYRDTLSSVAGCDSIIVLTLTVVSNITTPVSKSICAGSSYSFGGQILTTGGTYRDTLTSVAGCDSIVVLTLTTISPVTTPVSKSICTGSSYTFGGRTLTTAGTYSDTVTAVSGCDSIIILTLTTISPVTTPVSKSICAGSSYTLGGHVLTTGGTYRDTVTAVSGCDSIIVLTLTVIPAVTTPVSHSMCTGGSYTFGGHTLTTTGIYNDTLTAVSGCDSTVILTLTVIPAVTTPLSHSICSGSSYTFGGHILTTGGTYRDTLTAVSGCDSIIILTLTTISPVTMPVSQSICSGSSYILGGQTLTTSGTYRDTLTAVSGCDSIIILTLTVVTNATTPVSHSICSGSSYTFGGQILTTAGTYRDTVSRAAGCDSVVVLTLTVISPVTTPVSRSICAGSSYIFGGRTLTTAGTYSDTLTAVSGCDSIIILTLTTISPVTTPVAKSICAGSSYIFGGRTLTTAGTYSDTLTAISGCDSIIILTLTTISPVTTPVSHSICSGSSYTFGGQVLTTAGTYSDTLTAISGCDSIIILTLTTISPVTTPVSHSICSGGSYTFGGQVLTTAGTYRDTLTAVSGCDSIIALTLSVIAVQTTPVSQSICNGTSIIFGGQTITTAGTYRDTLTGIQGCDSIVVLTVTILQPSASAISDTICSNGSFLFNGRSLTTAGIYTAILTNTAGCDSVVVLSLAVLPTVTTPVSQSVCSGSSYTFGGQILTAAGTYTDTLTSVSGCDSFVVLALTVLPTVTTPVSQSICSGSSYTFGGQVLTTAGIYTDTLTAVSGCDSFVVLTLTVVSPVTTPVSQSICSSSSYTFGGQTLTTAGTYSDTLAAVSGCDSIIVLTLSVIPVQTISISQSICNGTSITFGGQTITTAGTYSDTVTGVQGCDSIVVLTVTILQPTSSAISQTICSNSSIVFNGQTLNTSGIYTANLTNAAGCDSTVTLTLTVIPASATAIVQSICRGSSYIFDGQVLTTPGTYTDSFTNVSGCDSIVTLTLSVLPIPSDTIIVAICSGHTYTFNGQAISTAGTYRDTFTTAQGCDSFQTLSLTVLPLPVASFMIEPKDTPVPMGVISVTDQSTGADTVLWQLNDQAIALLSGGQLPIFDTGSYCIRLIATTTGGCSDTSTECIYVFENAFAMGNAFTPNGDGKNDLYYPVFISPDSAAVVSFMIYNRWGQLVYDNPLQGWDGTYKGEPQPAEIYTYFITVELPDMAHPGQMRRISKQGTVALLR